MRLRASVGALFVLLAACGDGGGGGDGSGSSEIGSGASATPESSAPAIPPTTTLAPPYVHPGKFGPFLERAPRSPDGVRHLTMTLPNGQSLPVTIAEDAVDLLGSMALSEEVYVSCPPPGPSCGDAEPTAYATEDLWPTRTLETLPGSDGKPVQLVEHSVAGRALRYVRSGWTVEVRLFSVPEGEYSRWAVGLTPIVDDEGWLHIETSGGLRIGSGGGLNPVVTLFREDADIRLITGTTCSPANDGETPTTSPDGRAFLFAQECGPTSGVLISAGGEPKVVRRLMSAISVG